MEIQITMRYLLTQIRMAIIDKLTSAGQDVKKGEPFCTVYENAYWCSATMESTMEIPQKIKNGIAL